MIADKKLIYKETGEVSGNILKVWRIARLSAVCLKFELVSGDGKITYVEVPEKSFLNSLFEEYGI